MLSTSRISTRVAYASEVCHDDEPAAFAGGEAPLAELPDPSSETWPIAILGVPFDPLTLERAAQRIEAMIAERRPRYVVTPNVDFLVQARHDAELHQILVQADLVLCDGKPLVWASHWLGNSLPGRVAGSDLVPVLLERAARHGWKIFLLGGAEGAGAEAARRIAAAHPTLPPVAHYSPPFGPLATMDHDEILARVRAAKPDLMLVCFGCPKQEKWIFSHYRAAGVPVMIGAGGTIDFLAGRLKRAPLLMRRTGTEWLFRLWQEPRRLYKRYATDLLQFGPALLAQFRHFSRWTAKRVTTAAVASCALTSYGVKVQVIDRLERDTLQTSSVFWLQTVKQAGHCLLDLSNVKAIDSTGLAFLAHWQRSLGEIQRNLILFRPSPEVYAALERMRLRDHFIISDGPMANGSSLGGDDLKAGPQGGR